jgi:hypothetical protein
MAINRTPFNALVDDDGSNTVGSIWGKQDIKDVILDPVDAFVSNGGVWSTYAPNWGGGDAIGPTLNNGVLSGRYLQIGKWIDLVIVLKMGSTTSFGTSSYWYWTLPFAPALVASSFELTFRAGAQSAGGLTAGGLTGYFLGLGTGVVVTTTAGGIVNPTTPFTWSANALLSIRGSYEVP